MGVCVYAEEPVNVSWKYTGDLGWITFGTLVGQLSDRSLIVTHTRLEKVWNTYTTVLEKNKCFPGQLLMSVSYG